MPPLSTFLHFIHVFYIFLLVFLRQENIDVEEIRRTLLSYVFAFKKIELIAATVSLLKTPEPYKTSELQCFVLHLLSFFLSLILYHFIH